MGVIISTRDYTSYVTFDISCVSHCIIDSTLERRIFGGGNQGDKEELRSRPVGIQTVVFFLHLYISVCMVYIKQLLNIFFPSFLLALIWQYNIPNPNLSLQFYTVYCKQATY